MAKIIRWSLKAADDLENIVEYIAQDSLFYASNFARKLLVTIENISEFPKLGRIVPEYSDENIREYIYLNYRIVYRLLPKTVEIITISHGSKPL